MNWERMVKFRFTSGFMIRSTYRWRQRVSTSVSPWNFSGRGSRDLDSRVMVFALMEISPRLVRNTSPSAPTISPISYFLKALSVSSPTSSMRT